MTVEGSGGGKGSTRAAFWNFFKSMFGAGILALPHAFADAGLVAGGIAYSIAVVSCIESMLLTLRCKAEAVRQLGKSETEVRTYPQLAECALGKMGYWAVTVLVVLLEGAFCVGWVIIAANNISQNAALWGFPVTRGQVAACLFLIIGGLSCIQWLSELYICSVFGFVVYFCGVIGVSYGYIAASSAVPGSAAVELVRWHTLPRFFGTAIYGLEAILMALPIQGSMDKQDEAPWVIRWGIAVYAVQAGVFGAVCYSFGLAHCGPDGNGIITDCFPDGWIASSVQLALAASMVVGYPVILYPVTEIVEGYLLGAEVGAAKAEGLHIDSEYRNSARDGGYARMPVMAEDGTAVAVEEASKAEAVGRWRGWQRCGIRLVEVGLSCLLASQCDNFDAFANVVGSIFIPVIGFITPPVLHVSLHGTAQLSVGELALDVYLVVLGMSVLTMGVYAMAGGGG